MGRKTVLLIVMMLASLFIVFADTTITPLHMKGYVFGETSFSLSILDSALPFDLESPSVAENVNYSTTLSGIRIGNYSLESNVTAFVLYIAHSPLILTERSFGTEGDEGTLSVINYRLYMEMGGNSFKSCLSDYGAGGANWNAKTASVQMVLSGTDSSDWPPGTTLYSGKGLYVTLEDRTSGTTAGTVSDLMAGTYTSTIYFLLEGGR